ncbi:unnamed protein product [Larinioides sclopetarius]|uniref:Uncharacterized protein n=1 Tax=Larinioides sclopetarius TaxID=280406 RepID=A0AAV2ACF4_9ARAC
MKAKVNLSLKFLFVIPPFESWVTSWNTKLIIFKKLEQLLWYVHYCWKEVVEDFSYIECLALSCLNITN